MSTLIEAYDVAFFDLDGVIYLGPVAVPGAAQALEGIRDAGKSVMYVTNNAARSASVVINQLESLGFAADEDCVLTSAQVAVAALGQELPPGSRVLVSGSRSLADLVAEAGLVPVSTAAEQPAAVLQGYDPNMTWPRLDEAALAIQAGARWYATNDDPSRPTDRGLVPGAGAAIAVLATAIGGSPTVFGKPFKPMLEQAIQRTRARCPIFVGDRIDTDIIGAVNVGIDSLLVFTGAHGKFDLVAAGPNERPTHIGADVGALLLPPRTVQLGAGSASCAGQVAELDKRTIRLRKPAEGMLAQLDALWAVVNLAWARPEVDASGALVELDLLP